MESKYKDGLKLLSKCNLDNIENKTIKDLKELLSTKNKEYCPCKLKIFLRVNGGIIYSDYNDTPDKTIKECFPEKIIRFLYCSEEKCECNCENKELLNLTKLQLLNKLIEIQNELMIVNSLNNEVKNKIKENNDNEINEFKNKIKEKDNEINEFKNKIVNIEKNKNILNENYKDKVKELEELNKEFKNYTERLIYINKKNRNFEIDNKIYINILSTDLTNTQENSYLDINTSITNYINNDKENNELFNKKKSYDFYDIIINIKSIKDINKGWEIKMNERGENNYKLYKNKEIIKIGVIGNANKGKSFILSKLSKINLPSGTSIRTEGLSIKYPELKDFKNRKIVLLDSIGLETPILRKNKISIKEELFEEKSRDNLMTELFLQNFIIYNSDILILVIDILTYSEQKLLNRIKTQIIKSKLNKSLYVIHNLKTFVEKEQVENYIKKYLLRSATFKLKEGHKISTTIKQNSGIYYYENNENIKIFHLIFANEKSNAGNYYNNYTLEFLENSYQQIINLKPFDIINNIKERFIEESKELIDNSSFKSFLSINDLLDNENILKEKKIRLKDKNINIKLKQFYINEIGISIMKNNDYDPFYNIYRKDNQIIIKLESPGIDIKTIKSQIYISGKYNIIEIKGIKKRDLDSGELGNNIFNNREFGNFCIKIPFVMEKIKLKNELSSINDNKNGIIVLKYEIEDKKIFSYFKSNENEI